MDKKPLIVGVDPGSTSAVAAVDLQGEIELLESGKNFPPRDIIQRIIKVGKPVVLASDKAKTPSTVEKISTSLGARLFEPEEDLSQQKKKELGKGANSHELDAVASAVHAYKQLHKEIRKIEKLSREEEFSEAEIAAKVFNQEPVTELEESNKENDQDKTETDSSNNSSNNDPEKQRLNRKIDNLESQVQKLKSELGENKSDKENLRAKISRLRSEERKEIRKEEEVEKQKAKVKRKEEEINDLQEEIEDYKVREKQYRKAIQKLFHNEYELIPIVDDKVEEVPEKAVTRNEELIEVLEPRGCNIYHVEQVEGVELNEYYVVESFPEPKNFESIIKDYRESR